MKVSYTFDPDDFEGSGQRLIANHFPMKVKNYDSIASYAAMIGYLVNGTVLLISLEDGMVYNTYDSKEALCADLNKEKRWRPMSEKEMIEMDKIQGNRFQ